MRLAFNLSLAIISALSGVAALTAAAAANDIFIVKSTAKAPDAVVADIKSYAEQKKWQYLGEAKVKNGEVSLVKVCIPAVGQVLWSAGLQVSAMLPCGNIGVYRKGDATEISLLHPRYMHVLYPHPATEKASAIAQPLFDDLLETVTRPAQN